MQIAAQTIVEKLSRKFESSGKSATAKRPKRSALEQQREVLYGEPLVVDPPLHRGPVDPIRTVAEQLAALGFPQPEVESKARAP